MQESSWSAGYDCLDESGFASGAYALRCIAWDDRHAIREWRNQQIDILRQVAPLTTAQQDAYFSDVIRPQLSTVEPEQILFSYLEDGRAIGYGGLVNLAWHHRRAEVSFLVDPQRLTLGKYDQDLSIYLEMISRIAFDDLALHRLTTETSAVRVDHVATLERSGFALEGVLVDHRVVDDGYGDSLLHAKVNEVPYA